MTRLKMRAAVYAFGFISAMTALAPMTSAGTLDEIKARGTLIVGAEVSNPPFVYKDDDGDVVGYEPAIVSYVADKLGVKYEIVDTSWAGLLPALMADKFDALLTAMPVTHATMKKVDFTTPYAIAGQGFVVHADSDIHSVADLPGKAIGIGIGSSTAKDVERYNKKLAAEGLKPIVLRTYERPVDALADLENKRIDAATSMAVAVKLWIATRPKGMYRFVDYGNLTDKTVLIAATVQKGNDSLLNFLDDTLQEMRDNGKLEELQIKWLGGKQDVPTTLPDSIP